ncbi:ammonia channel protein [Aeromicrobium sp. Root495]|uniref:ammonium transporter n=1 Tax=Aeromicrobium sp. Root495 TaxID=1736550 RepID=UPI000701364B|nr:ammonium transporter [Aeromicrobium sp. Root495]KQY59583.1 ammonia channel protein [Aeromicrobium sp. Root495]RYE79063.1 MAG: ammonium transporter [Hyphomicrobiales bacterium]
MDLPIFWLLITAALVLFMTPGLAFFYGGLVRAKSVVSMMMLSFGAIGLVGVLWMLFGANMAFVDGTDSDWIPEVLGNPFSDFGLNDAAKAAFANEGGGALAGIIFGSTFAIITVALISGAIADRARFFPWMLFAGLFATLVYFPVASWVFSFVVDDDGAATFTGWVGQLGSHLGLDASTIDFAGGTAVHINAGAAALALALVLGKRVGFSKELSKPHNVPLVLIGAAILWFGWFGFNGGAATTNDQAALIFVNTLVCPAAGILGWIITEHFKNGKATSIGAASGAVTGLVAITPACANLTPVWAIVLGLVAGAVCALAVELKFKLGFDDSLDVVGIHLVAGFIGTLYLGFFAIDTGLFTGGGNLDQLIVQVIPAFAIAAYSFVMAFVIGTVINKTIGFRVHEDEEAAGIDTALHGESGYALD